MSHNLTREFFENLRFMVNNITNLRFNLPDNSKTSGLLVAKNLAHKKAMAIVTDLSDILKNPANINMKDLIHANNKNDPAFQLFEQITIFIQNTIKKIQEKAKTITKHGNLQTELEELIKSTKNTQHNIMQLRNASNTLNPNNIFTAKLDSLNHALSELLLTSNKIVHPISNTPPKFTVFSANNPKKKKIKKLPEILPAEQHKNNLHQRTTGRHNKQ